MKGRGGGDTWTWEEVGSNTRKKNAYEGKAKFTKQGAYTNISTFYIQGSENRYRSQFKTK